MEFGMQDKIDAILKWAKYNPKFDATFVEDINTQDFDFTAPQEVAIDNIIDGFKIKIERWSN